MLVLEGKTQSGFGEAQKTLASQHPHLIRVFPEIKTVKIGTINVHLKRPFWILHPDFTTDPISWIPDRPDYFEVFGLTRVNFEVMGKQTNAWIYEAYNSPHRANLFSMEIIAPPIKGLSINMNCKIYLNRDIAKENIIVV